MRNNPWCRRLFAAWRLLRHGELQRPTASVEVSRAELRDLVECALAAVGLPFTWAGQATSEELAMLERAVGAARRMREAEWNDMEAGTGLKSTPTGGTQ